MRLILAHLLLLILVCACNNEKIDGGYDFVANIPDSDTHLYAYPIKDKLVGRDSVWQNFFHYTYEDFNEPNISLHPSDKPIFRLEYNTAFGFPHVMITLHNEKLIIKEATNVESNYKFEFSDSLTKLTPVERVHFTLLELRYPIKEYLRDYAKWHPKKQQYFDSLIKASPELLTPKYFKYLTEKALVKNPEKFIYTQKEIRLSKEEYQTLVDSINASGYWKLPIYLPEVKVGADGYSFNLEANAYGKYHMVYANCWDTVIVPYMKSLQEIINRARLSKEINIYETQKEVQERKKPILIQNFTLENLNPQKRKKKKK